MNLRITVPVRGRLKLEQALCILVVNLIVPGLGTVLLTCLYQEKITLTQTKAAPISQEATTITNTK